MMMMFQKAQKNLGSCWTSLLVPVELSGLNFVRRERAIHVDEYEVDHSLILTQKFSDNGYCKQVVNFHVQGQDIVITVLNYEKEHDRFLMNLSGEDAQYILELYNLHNNLLEMVTGCQWYISTSYVTIFSRFSNLYSITAEFCPENAQYT